MTALRRNERRDGGQARRASWWVIAMLCVGGLAFEAGCNRAHYRRQADQEAYALIQEKANNPLWDLQDYEIYIDPRSRMFDPFDPDTPPLPPDDPAAHEYMHEVYGIKGYPGWHYSGETPFVENPAWRDYLPTDDDGIIHLNTRLVHDLGRLHSRNYQGELEELYLSALDVSFERFRFDSQFFAGYQLFSTWDGRDRRAGGGSSRSLFAPTTYSKGRDSAAWTMQRSFATGGDLVVSFANSLVWQFAGPNDYTGTTLLNFSMVQPLLRGAGKDRILERLTLSERTLLSNVRAMERYRRAFYVELMTGRNTQATDSPSRRGGVLGGSGLEGFSGSGTGGFGRLAGGGGIGGGGVGNTGAGAGQAGGFIGLLQQQQQIRNQEENIARLRTNLYRLETSLNEMLTTIPPTQEQIPRQRLQVAQSRQALVLAESRLINARNAFETQLDTYKGTLGLPPDICIQLDDPMLDQFQLIDRSMQEVQLAIDEVIDEVGHTNDKILAEAKEERDPDTDIKRRAIEWNEKLAKNLETVRRDMEPVKQIQQTIVNERMKEIERDVERLREATPRRIAALKRLREKYEEQKDCLCPLLPVPSIDPTVFDVEQIEKVDDELAEELERLRTRFGEIAGRHEKFETGVKTLREEGSKLEPFKLFERVRDDAVLGSQNLLTDLRLDLLALELCQARARTYAIELVPVDLPAPTAFEIAARYRPDLMNARAALVDSWRLIEFNADNLESTLDVVFSGDVTNPGQNPFDLRWSTGRMRAGVQFDAPIVRLAERNTYRQSLIEYQQARRNFYNSLDGISRSIRSTVRTIETNQFNFEIQRFAVLAAIQQIDLNEDIRVLNENQRATRDTAARDSVSALNDLLNAQNDFLSIWINYELQRMFLDLDLGTMQLDEEGNWVDPGAIGPDYGERMEAILGGDIPEPPDAASQAEPIPPGNKSNGKSTSKPSTAPSESAQRQPTPAAPRLAQKIDPSAPPLVAQKASAGTASEPLMTSKTNATRKVHANPVSSLSSTPATRSQTTAAKTESAAPASQTKASSTVASHPKPASATVAAATEPKTKTSAASQVATPPSRSVSAAALPTVAKRSVGSKLPSSGSVATSTKPASARPKSASELAARDQAARPKSSKNASSNAEGEATNELQPISDEQVVLHPPAVYVAPLTQASHRDSTGPSPDQPKSVTVVPATAIDPEPRRTATTSAPIGGPRLPPVVSPPKLKRPQPARRIGEGTATKATMRG